VIELDRIFWQAGLTPIPRDQWVAIQQKLVTGDRWIIDGDLWPSDVIEIRLRAADTIIFLEFSLLRCAWRPKRRSHEGFDSWRWLLAYRYKSRPILRAAIAKHAANAELYVFHSPRALRRFVADIATGVRCDKRLPAVSKIDGSVPGKFFAKKSVISSPLDVSLG
jgi:hypothetical protein